MTNMQPNFTVEEENEALISFLRADYDDALEQIRVLKSDVNELIDILRKHSIEVLVSGDSSHFPSVNFSQ